MTPSKRIRELVAGLPPEYHSMAREIGKEMYRAKPIVGQRLRVDKPDIVATFLRAKLEDFLVEQFHIITLDSRLNIMGHHVIAQGGASEVHVKPREVMRPAILDLASAIICAHNHPSGEATPSADDLVLTTRLIIAGEVIGIKVLDHLVVAKDGYTSMHESNYGVWEQAQLMQRTVQG